MGNSPFIILRLLRSNHVCETFGRVPIRIFYHTSSISIVICLLRAHLVRVPIHVVRRTILDKLASALDNYQVWSSAH
jgi:hypothetical protein